ncbi:MAG: GNAT family N-acetyltransferase [Butyrivibrio sp.]
MKKSEFSYEILNRHNENDFYSLVSEYLPDSSQGVMAGYAIIYPKAFIALTSAGKICGVVYGWSRKHKFPEDDSFMLDGIAIRTEYQGRGLGKLLLKHFEAAAVEYGADEVSVGSAGGYVEKFYMECGYVPVQYKVWNNGIPEVVKRFTGTDDYYAYNDRPQNGFVVMKKELWQR